jgi:hypothetical protein
MSLKALIVKRGGGRTTKSASEDLADEVFNALNVDGARLVRAAALAAASMVVVEFQVIVRL